MHITPAELVELNAKIDALLRPLIAAHRSEAPPSAELVNVNVFAFPRVGEPWKRARR